MPRLGGLIRVRIDSVEIESLLIKLFVRKFKENPSAFGSFLKNLRINAEVRAQNAALALGIDMSTFSRIENDILLLNEKTIREYATKLAKVSGIAEKIIDMAAHFDSDFTEELKEIAISNGITHIDGKPLTAGART